MRVWLRSTPDAIGLDCDVVPREALASVLALDAAAVEVHARCEQALSQAQARAQTLIEEAQQQAEAILHDARQKAERSARLGYAAGLRRQLDEWNESGLRHAFAAETAAHRHVSAWLRLWRAPASTSSSDTIPRRCMRVRRRPWKVPWTRPKPCA